MNQGNHKISHGPLEAPPELPGDEWDEGDLDWIGRRAMRHETTRARGGATLGNPCVAESPEKVPVGMTAPMSKDDVESRVRDRSELSQAEEQSQKGSFTATLPSEMQATTSSLIGSVDEEASDEITLLAEEGKDDLPEWSSGLPIAEDTAKIEWSDLLDIVDDDEEEEEDAEESVTDGDLVDWNWDVHPALPTVQTGSEIAGDGARLTRFEKAERLVRKTLKVTELDPDEAWKLLLRIYLHSPWPRTLQSIVELAQRGIPIEVMSLAGEIRRVWTKYPEFGVVVDRRHWHIDGSVTYARLSWINAARIADSWPCVYPDIEEIEVLLCHLYEQWRHSRRMTALFPAFLNFVVSACNDSRWGVDSLPGCSFLPADLDFDLVDFLDDPERCHVTRETLERVGISPPQLNVWRSYRGSHPVDTDHQDMAYLKSSKE